jgi:hypothetical protein
MTTLGKLSRRDALGLLVLQALALSGCSFGVMAGKFLTGDPKLDAQFKSMTGVNLAKGKHKVVVVCTIPAVVDEDLSTLNLDIIEGVTRRMKLAGVDVISPDDVAAWIDENGGVVTDPSAMAQAFEADYIAWIDLQAFSIREENSANLLRGRVQGFVRAYKVEEINGDRTALSAFNTEFTTTYPAHQPVSELGRSALLFQKEFNDRVCDELAEKFYDHRPGNNI